MTNQTPLSTLSSILDTVGFDALPADHVSFSGTDPILPSNFLIGTAGAASIAACGLAAADLWELRTGRRQDVGMDVRTGAIAMRCSRYTRKLGGEASSGMADISDFYQCGDGHWVQLHCNFPHHLDGSLKILGCEANKEAVAAAVKGWDAAKLEETLVAAGMCLSLIHI